MDRLVLFVIAVAIAFGIGCLGRKRKIGFGWAFGLSLINAIIGLIAVLCSKKLDETEIEVKRNRNDERIRLVLRHPRQCLLSRRCHQWQQCVWASILVSPGHLSRTSGKKSKRKIKNITEYLAILSICRIFAANI